VLHPHKAMAGGEGSRWAVQLIPPICFNYSQWISF